MKKDFIIARIKQMEEGKRSQEHFALQANANVNAFSGAIQELTFLLKTIEQDEQKEIENGETNSSEAQENP